MTPTIEEVKKVADALGITSREFCITPANMTELFTCASQELQALKAAFAAKV